MDGRWELRENHIWLLFLLRKFDLNAELVSDRVPTTRVSPYPPRQSTATWAILSLRSIKLFQRHKCVIVYAPLNWSTDKG